MSLNPSFKGVTVTLLALALLAVPVSGWCSWTDVDDILREAYGPEVARECKDYFSGLNIPEDQVRFVRDAVVGLVEAGYPEGCPREYLKYASELTRADIGLLDLTNKIREGVAKKVPPERLIRVVGQRTEALKEARVIVLGLSEEGIDFLDRQMAFSVVADYLLRGIQDGDLKDALVAGDLSKYPALENVVR